MFEKKSQITSEEVRLATVTGYDASQGLLIKFDGESNARTKRYRRIGSYIPSVGHRVLVQKLSGTYIVIGRIQ